MANSANITAYADDAIIQYTFRPLQRSEGVQEYIENSTTKANNQLCRLRLSEFVQKNKMMRRQKQTVFPVMEDTAGSGSAGYVAPPKVAHEVIVQTTVICHPRATASDIANALKLHESTIITDTGAAGTANAYRDVSNQIGEVLVRGFMPA